ncbi:hypothetical protein BN59_00307 [Legionella massiliensis]|uniref:Uncharacterized protein n=1 Tax=Legionella massiliensis TaxID=1034943 RepID=A0A078KWH5_9GAMM|nr:OTU domain-containing protein [Legionella massiliensis]CDZ76043.1 hypothetical protein BN59_00307 [Legionella massiliensis]CEE11781.1 hypothetical protein BN1094_00307 [Legionella massiliensis]
MAEKISTPVTSGFFGSKFKTDLPHNTRAVNTTSKLTYVDVGGDADSDFRSVAAAMIDNILLVRSRANQDLAKKLLEIHATHFEQTQIPVRLMTHAEILAKLLEAPQSRAKFLNELAYALRQETVSEMVNNPVRYRPAFVANKNLSPEEMRQQSTKLHPCAMAALSTAMQVPVELHEVEPNKEGQKLTVYNAGLQLHSASPIALLRHGDDNFALLNRPEYFSMMNRQKIEPIHPKAVSFKDPLLEEIHVKIAAEDQYLVQEYEHTVKRLNKWLQVGELSKESLLNGYIKNLGSEHQEQTKYVGIEHGSQHLFEELLTARKMLLPMQSAGANHEEQVTSELVRAVARKVSTGQMDISLVYEAEEKPSLSM